MLLSAHIKRVSVSCMQDFFLGGGALTVMPKAYLIGIGASIRIGQESWCRLYAVFFHKKMHLRQGIVLELY